MLTSFVLAWNIQLRSVCDEVFWSRLFGAIVQLTNPFSHHMIYALAPHVIITRLQTVER